MDKLTIKTPQEVKIMHEAGMKLGRVKKALKKAIVVGENALNIEKLACDLIAKEGAEPSFSKVPGYSWATCINVNSGLVHGIPKTSLVFKKGDVVSVDVGLYWQGFHSDTSFTVGLDVDSKIAKFLATGEKALAKAISSAKAGNYISDISRAMQETVEKEGYSMIRALTGHGIGRELHEEPAIYCFINKARDVKIVPGMVLAIEVMYAMGFPEIQIEKDGWTISTQDGKISALYEETVAVDGHGRVVLTSSQ
jgi:methionyl aminopeptidase